MKIDYIVKGELWRSIAVYFLFLFLIITLDHKGYISIDGLTTIILAFFFTMIVFSLLVWYRRKEQLLNPSIFLIINHIFESESYNEKTTEPQKNEETSIFLSIRKNLYNRTNSSLLILIILLYITYLYASLVYNIAQIFWALFLLFMGIALSKVIYPGFPPIHNEVAGFTLRSRCTAVFVFPASRLLKAIFLAVRSIQ